MVENGLVGVVVKSWSGSKGNNHDVYVRGYNRIENYKEEDIKHFIYNKELSNEDLDYYDNQI